MIKTPTPMARPWDAAPSSRSDIMAVTPMDRHVGSRMRLRRMELGLSATRVAEAVGRTRQQVEKWEKGDGRLAAGQIYEVAKILNVAPGWFFDGFVSGSVPLGGAPVLTEIAREPGLLEMATQFTRLLPEQKRSVRTIVEGLHEGNIALHHVAAMTADAPEEE